MLWHCLPDLVFNECRPGCQLCDDGLPHGCDSWFKVDHFEFQQHINVELVLTVWETGVLVSKKHTQLCFKLCQWKLNNNNTRKERQEAKSGPGAAQHSEPYGSNLQFFIALKIPKLLVSVYRARAWQGHKLQPLALAPSIQQSRTVPSVFSNCDSAITGQNKDGCFLLRYFVFSFSSGL